MEYVVWASGVWAEGIWAHGMWEESGAGPGGDAMSLAVRHYWWQR